MHASKHACMQKGPQTHACMHARIAAKGHIRERGTANPTMARTSAPTLTTWVIIPLLRVSCTTCAAWLSVFASASWQRRSSAARNARFTRWWRSSSQISASSLSAAARTSWRTSLRCSAMRRRMRGSSRRTPGTVRSASRFTSVSATASTRSRTRSDSESAASCAMRSADLLNSSSWAVLARLMASWDLRASASSAPWRAPATDAWMRAWPSAPRRKPRTASRTSSGLKGGGRGCCVSGGGAEGAGSASGSDSGSQLHL
mmetsp:Transcript_69740/g.215655  ORF Transcript_69740/g.215655 Transcript_69740/m.215655 type:complete len:259 (-) Transcript_69740:168-944(-)